PFSRNLSRSNAKLHRAVRNPAVPFVGKLWSSCNCDLPSAKDESITCNQSTSLRNRPGCRNGAGFIRDIQRHYSCLVQAECRARTVFKLDFEVSLSLMNGFHFAPR